MTPPEDPEDGTATTGKMSPAVSVCLPAADLPHIRLETLRIRPDFLRAARARRQASTGMMVQGRKRDAGEATGIRVGFTCSKKVGNAVARNRAKRRLPMADNQQFPIAGFLVSLCEDNNTFCRCQYRFADRSAKIDPPVHSIEPAKRIHSGPEGAGNRSQIR